MGIPSSRCRDTLCIHWIQDSLFKRGLGKPWTFYSSDKRWSQWSRGSYRWAMIQYLIWQYRLWSFQMEGTKLEIFLPKNQHTQRKLLNFENWVDGKVSKSANSQFSMSKIIQIFLIFFIEEYQFRSTFFDNINF